jgi:hypothetical protein
MIELQNIIEEFEKIRPCLQKHDPNGISNFHYYSYGDKEEEYLLWLAKTQRFLEIKYPNDKHVKEFLDVSNNQELTPVQQSILLAILTAFLEYPTIIPIPQEPKQNSITIQNTNTQSQSQEQSLAIHLLIEAIKDNLTGRQIKELKEIVAEADNDLQKACPNILAKLKEFGVDVVSNVVANILTNPTIWTQL